MRLIDVNVMYRRIWFIVLTPTSLLEQRSADGISGQEKEIKGDTEAL
jgi:hypothetical protein